MIQSQLLGHERKLLDKREGVPHAVRVLLRRAQGLDILDPGEDLDIEEIKREFTLQDGTVMPIVFNVVRKLFYPVPGFRGNLVPDEDGTMYYPAS